MFKVFYYILMCIFIFNNSLALGDEQKTNNIGKKLNEFGVECIVEYPLTSDDIDSFRNKTFPENENAGCFVACVFNKSGIMDDNGELSQTTVIENAKTIFEDETDLKNLEESISVCAIKVKSEDITDNKCDQAKVIYNCLIKNTEQFGFNIGL